MSIQYISHITAFTHDIQVYGMARWVFSHKNTKCEVTRKQERVGGAVRRESERESSQAYVEARSGGTSFPSCSVISLLAISAMHCMASVLKVGLRDSRSCRIDWMIRFIRSWPSLIITITNG